MRAGKRNGFAGRGALRLVAQCVNIASVNVDFEDLGKVTAPCFVACTPLMSNGLLLLVGVDASTFTPPHVFARDDENAFLIR